MRGRNDALDAAAGSAITMTAGDGMKRSGMESSLPVVVRRLRAACRTNEPQGTTVIGMMALSGISLLQRTAETPWWFAVGAVAMWPIIAFIANIAHPIPEDREE